MDEDYNPFEETGDLPLEEGGIDVRGGFKDRERTSGRREFTKRTLYEMSLEGKMMLKVKKDLEKYQFTKPKENQIIEIIQRHDSDLKLLNPETLVSAVIFINTYGNKGGLTKKNIIDYKDSTMVKNVNILNLIRYVRFINNLEE